MLYFILSYRTIRYERAENEGMTIPDFLRLLKRRAVPILLSMLACGILALFLVLYILPAQYTASTTFCVRNRISYEDGITSADIAACESLTGPCMALISGSQTMTLAAMAPYADAPVHISHIGHIRLQESDRIHAIVTELRRAGIRCEEEEDALTIYPGVPHAAVIKTYEDHRMAMAFSLLGLRTDGIIIDDPLCCKKTFENYFELFTMLTQE